jgi:hypothetical protein
VPSTPRKYSDKANIIEKRKTISQKPRESSERTVSFGFEGLSLTESTSFWLATRDEAADQLIRRVHFSHDDHRIPAMISM